MIQGAKKISELQTLTVNGSEIVPVVQDDGLGNLTTGTLPITNFGTDTNFANTDLALTRDRTHDLNGKLLQFDNGKVIIGSAIGADTKLEVVSQGASNAIIAISDASTAVTGSSNTGLGVDAISYSGAGVYGRSVSGAGVYGKSDSGTGMLAESVSGVAGDFKGGLFVEVFGGSGTINASAIIQADSTTKGALLPRMTTAQRNAIPSPANYLTIVNTDTNRYEMYHPTFGWTVIGYIEPLEVASTVISFTDLTIYNSVASPATGNITNDLTGAKKGIIQKIYHQHTSAPTVPAGWVLRGGGIYVPSTLNIIYATFAGGTRVEYWIA